MLEFCEPDHVRSRSEMEQIDVLQSAIEADTVVEEFLPTFFWSSSNLNRECSSCSQACLGILELSQVASGVL